MEKRKVATVLAPLEPHYVGDGFRVSNFIPGQVSMRRMNPFIMLDYNSKFYFPPSEKPRGVSVHPHRGFETVTIAYKGSVAHHDSSGGGGVIGEGDVQWMTAASGVLHKEYHEESFSKQGGDFHMVQLWTNLPAKDKMSSPRYQAISKDKMVHIPLPQGGEVEIIAGNFKNKTGPAITVTPINLFNVRLPKNTSTTLSFPAIYNTALLLIEGSVKINDQNIVQTDHFVLFENNSEEFIVEAIEDAVVLLMSGEPIEEPIASYGPFVMNTQAELIQAVHDFQDGKFGYLAE
ncbi:MAG: pirin family protein [Bacteroidetes bacterium]|nr:pirin family protein [Bacteroidota bacterium]